MNLLDLPPEMFQHVVHELVGIAGVTATWKLRSVCRTFASEIEHDIFTQQPKDAFQDHSRFFNKGSTRFILMRLKAPRDANKDLFAKFNNMVDFLAEEVGFTGKKERLDYAEKLIDGLTGMVAQPIHDVWCNSDTCWCPSRRWRQVPELNIYDKLCAAMAVKAYDVFRDLLPAIVTATSGPGRYLPCEMLETAAEQDDMVLLDIILEFLKSLNPNDNPTALEDMAFNSHGTQTKVIFPVFKVIHRSIMSGDAKVTKVLLDFSADYLKKPDRYIYDDWVYDAIRLGDEKVLQLVLDFSPGRKSMVCSHQVRIACNSGRSSAIEAIIPRLPTDINTGSILTLPLFIAVRSGRVTSVQTILDLGANIDITAKSNFPSIRKEHVTPLEVAIYRKFSGIAQCLIKGGATIPHISEWPYYAPIHDLFREAELNRTGVRLPSYKEFKWMHPSELKALKY